MPTLTEPPRSGLRWGHHFLFRLPLSGLEAPGAEASADERCRLEEIGPDGIARIRVEATGAVQVTPAGPRDLKVSASVETRFDARRGRLVSSTRRIEARWGGARFERTDRVTLSD